MSLVVVADHLKLVSVINEFNPSYHEDYLRVRRLAELYLVSPSAKNVFSLACGLSEVLSRWGAGKRSAPAVQAVSVIEESLANAALHSLLRSFAALSVADLSMNGLTGRVVGGESTAKALQEFDNGLVLVLSKLAVGMLVGNTNVTYPMKALLLITGFMPALDSQVRKGLGCAGFAGTNVTRFALPDGLNSTEAKKITRIPFYLAECFRANAALLIRAATASRYPWIATEPGRLFDVLLFMQGAAGHSLVSLNPPSRDWYSLA